MNRKNNQILTIPNILSFFRIALIPSIMWAYVKGVYIFCATLVIISSISDIADGAIARSCNMVSALGKVLDPIADKLTLLSVLLCLSTNRQILYCLVGIFLLKEAIVGIEGLILLKITGTTYSAKWYGKLTTAVLYFSVLIFILFKQLPFSVVNCLFYSCVLVNIFSLIMYSMMNVRRINELSKVSNE